MTAEGTGHFKKCTSLLQWNIRIHYRNLPKKDLDGLVESVIAGQMMRIIFTILT